MRPQSVARPCTVKEPGGEKTTFNSPPVGLQERHLEEASNRSHVQRKRTRISEENLHISAFAVVGDGKGSILLLKAGQAHPLSFRRGNLAA